MHRFFTSLAQFCDTLNSRLGRTMAWLTLAVVLLMCANVVMRYAFNAGAPWQVELVLALHAATFLAAMGYTLQAGEQVRVDVLYARFTLRQKAWVDLLGSCILLFPMCIALMLFSWDFAASSWRLREASSEYNGLQGIFLLKAFILIGPACLMLQGVSVVIRACETLRNKGLPHG